MLLSLHGNGAFGCVCVRETQKKGGRVGVWRQFLCMVTVMCVSVHIL